jgi:hypothetical protein
MNITYHAKYERLDRLATIGASVGFGEVIKERVWVSNGKPSRRKLTSTGVILVYAMDSDTLITGWLASTQQAQTFFHKPLPSQVRRVIEVNEKKYRKMVDFY